ncbi:MAG: response regulator [Nitrospiraceae bacterium]
MHQSLKIVLAEESALVRERVKTLLLELPAVEVVGEATKALEVEEVIQAHQPDVLILDIDLPGSGLWVLSRVTRDWPAILVIVLTNQASDDYRRICLKAGAGFFFDKSYEFLEMAGTLDRVRRQLVRSSDS